jgi:hypothetical protein
MTDKVEIIARAALAIALEKTRLLREVVEARALSQKDKGRDS